MNSYVGLIFFLAAIAAGLLLERRDRRTRVTAATWLPFFWIFICASRSVSQWLGPGGTVGDGAAVDASLNGSPVDRLVLGVVIAWGLAVVWRRRETVWRLVQSNPWLLIFVLYLGLSVAWSDIGAVSLRRWFRLFGHVVMAAVLVSEPSPIEAVRSVLRRCAYVLVLVSVLFVRSYPDLGTMYTGEGKRYWTGAAVMKNGLAHLALIFTFVLVWDLVTRKARQVLTHRAAATFDIAVIILGLWLLRAEGRNSSATATACMALLVAILALSRLGWAKRAFARSGAVIVFGILVFFGVQSIAGVLESAVGLLGRDMTFTDRVPLWNVLMEFVLQSPLIGYGYGGFWTPDRARAVAAQTIAVTEAHNGYLEILLAGGLIGIVLFALVLARTVLNIQQNHATDYEYGVLRLSLFVLALVTNVTESCFIRERDLMTIVFFVIVFNDGVPLKSWKFAGAPQESGRAKPPARPARTNRWGVVAPLPQARVSQVSPARHPSSAGHVRSARVQPRGLS
jgi:exopolysaccharide production protein ExoQ